MVDLANAGAESPTVADNVVPEQIPETHIDKPEEKQQPSAYQSASSWPFIAAAQAQELKRTVVESTDSAIRSARSQMGELTDASSFYYSTAMEHMPKLKTKYQIYEDTFFSKLKEGVLVAREYPGTTGALVLGTGLLLMKSPRRFLMRNLVWRFQSEEAMLSSAQNKVNDIKQSVELLKNESKKLQERAVLAEEELQRGQKKLRDAGNQIQGLVQTAYKTESRAKSLMEVLREIPNREALKLRAEVATMADDAKKNRKGLAKQVSRITNYGIPV